MKIIFLTLNFLFLSIPNNSVPGDGYQIGDVATDFSLPNVDGKMVSLSDFADAKGFIVIFTCNTCHYSVAYEERIIALDNKYSEEGYPVIAINPNDPAAIHGDELSDMKVRAEEKGFTFPYLQDVGQQLQSAQMRIDQLNMAKEGLTAKLKEEVEKPQESEIVETPTEDG